MISLPLPRWLPVAFALVVTSHAGAQEAPSSRVQAGEAYDRGVRSFRARDFDAAARWFLTAYDVAPAPAALVQAIRAYANARDVRHAGTLALALENAVGLGPEAARTVQRALDAASRRLVRVEFACTAPCSLVVGGEAQRFPRVFVEPGHDVEVVVSYPGGTQNITVNGRAGARQTVPVQVPEPPPEAPSLEVPAEEVLTLEEGENPYRISRLRFLSRPRATFFVFSASSTVVYGITSWAALERGRLHDQLRRTEVSGTAEEIAVAEDRYRRSVRRTRGYLGFSGLVTLTSGLVAAFTDWTPHGDRHDDDDETGAEVQVDADGTGAQVSVVGRF